MMIPDIGDGDGGRPAGRGRESLLQAHDEADHWKWLVQMLILDVAGRLDRHGGPSERWAAHLEAARLELNSVWDSAEMETLRVPALHWLNCAIDGLVDGLVQRERRAAKQRAADARLRWLSEEQTFERIAADSEWAHLHGIDWEHESE
jgi:hypothetical protein